VLKVAFMASSSVWKSIGRGKMSQGKRMNALFFCVIHQGVVASMQGTYSFPQERSVMLRERASGMYHISEYFTAKSATDLLVFSIPPMIFSIIAYPTMGFQMTLDKFFLFLLFMVLDTLAAVSMATLISCVCVSIEMSAVVLAACYELTRMFGGWFIPPAMLAQYPAVTFFDALSYIKYTFIGVSITENEGLELECSKVELNSKGQCIIPPLMSGPYTGDRFSQYYGYSTFTIQQCIAALMLYIFCARVLSYLALRFIKI